MHQSNLLPGRTETGEQPHHPHVEPVRIKSSPCRRQPSTHPAEKGILRQKEMLVLPHRIRILEAEQIKEQAIKNKKTVLETL